MPFIMSDTHLYSQSTEWRSWLSPTEQRPCHFCMPQSSHQRQTTSQNTIKIIYSCIKSKQEHDCVLEMLLLCQPQHSLIDIQVTCSYHTSLKTKTFSPHGCELTCVALLPIFTTSNRVMFSIPFSWWWPFTQPGPGALPPPPPLALSPGAFLPFLAACWGDRHLMDHNAEHSEQALHV